MQNTMKTTSDTVFRKICTSQFIWKGRVWKWVGDRTELQHIDPHSYVHQRCVFLVLQGCSAGGQGPSLLGAGFLYCILSPTGLVSEINWLPVFTELYNSSTPSFFLWASQLHSFNPSTVKVIILIFLDRMHLLFT